MTFLNPISYTMRQYRHQHAFEETWRTLASLIHVSRTLTLYLQLQWLYDHFCYTIQIACSCRGIKKEDLLIEQPWSSRIDSLSILHRAKVKFISIFETMWKRWFICQMICRSLSKACQPVCNIEFSYPTLILGFDPCQFAICLQIPQFINIF